MTGRGEAWQAVEEELYERQRALWLEEAAATRGQGGFERSSDDTELVRRTDL